MHETPQTIVHIRPDTIGDLVIYSSALAELRALWPEAKHVIVVRRGYEELASLFPADIEWLVTRLNPFSQKPSECRGELEETLAAIGQLSPDLILASTLNRTWLEAAVASRFPQVRSVVLGSAAVDPIFANAVRLELRVEVATAFKEVAPAEPNALDWENQHRLVDYLAGAKTGRPLPRLSPPDAAVRTADKALADKGLAGTPWVAVFAAGLANVSVKAWPNERFGELIHWIQSVQKRPVLLLGHTSEAAILSKAAAAAKAAGGTEPAQWMGGQGDLPVLAALLSRASYYVGHDTGAMHIAAAVDRPVVGIFGGGHWPRFRPAARRGISVVQPLPCFGCNWDCHFGDGPCVKTIPVSSVTHAVETLLASQENPINQLEETRAIGAEALHLIEKATPNWQKLQADRIERQYRIEELKREADLKDVEIIELKGETDTKDAEIDSLKSESNTKDAEIDSLKKEADTKDAEIDSLKGETNTKDAEIDSLKAEANTKDAEIGDLKEAANVKDGEIDRLKAVCNERDALIHTQDGHIKFFQKTVASLNGAIGEKDAELSARAEKIAGFEKILAPLPKDAARWSQEFADKDNHIRNLEGFLREKDGQIAPLQQGIAERDRSLANYHAGRSELEQAKHFTRMLSEKESVIQDLAEACRAREKVINELAASGNGFTAALRKGWIWTRALVRDRMWAPFDRWLFRKIVEQHWMQIGILSHYPGRPLRWDKFPKKKLSDSRLPKVGIVTPSYNQDTFIESTLLSVLNQEYPKLLYVVQDGGSKDKSPEIIARYKERLHHYESAKDRGQADAVAKGFQFLEKDLGPNDVMAWLNSDDFIAPRVLRFVAEYFATHPHVDVIYGNRIIIDGHDKDVGRWIMPRHDKKALEWIDYVPQETLFWRKRAWDLAGGIDPQFQFALDWDILARFQQAGCTIVRVPYFLGCFRVHAQQKTSQAIHTTGAHEMAQIRQRFHGARHDNPDTIMRYARKTRFRGALNSRLQALGIRW